MWVCWPEGRHSLMRRAGPAGWRPLKLLFSWSNKNDLQQISATVPRALLVCLGAGHPHELNHQCSILILIWMVLDVLDYPLRDPAPHYLCSPHRLTPLDFATFFQCSFFGPDFSQLVPQSEYSSDVGAQNAPFWLPFWSPFWVRLQK